MLQTDRNGGRLSLPNKNTLGFNDLAGKIVIIGAGPSGCYVSQALLKRAPGLEIHIVDSLPVPYGLTRYGVAADHQGIK